jgi:hypothetical protein
LIIPTGAAAKVIGDLRQWPSCRPAFRTTIRSRSEQVDPHRHYLTLSPTFAVRAGASVHVFADYSD